LSIRESDVDEQKSVEKINEKSKDPEFVPQPGQH
jgi:hypothetical protein